MFRLDRNAVETALARKCMTTMDLAWASGLSYQAIIRALKPDAAVYPATIGKLARALGVDVTEIIASTDERR